MVAMFRVGDWVRIPDGRIGRVTRAKMRQRQANAEKYFDKAGLSQRLAPAGDRRRR